MLFISTIRIVNLLDNTADSNPPLLVNLLILASLVVSVSLYLTNMQSLNDYYIQNVNQKLVDKIFTTTSSNYFQATGLMIEILIHPIEPPIIWSIYKLNRAFLFRFSFVLLTILIICCQYAFYQSTAKANTNEVSFSPF